MYLLGRFSRILLIATLAVFAVFIVRHRSGADTRAPEIHVEESVIEASVADGEDVLLAGVTAYDRTDGDVTDSVQVENISTFYGDRKRLVTYVAFDSDNNVARATRELRYTDYEAPRFVLEEPMQYLPGGVNLKIEATDCLDGNISTAIKLVESDIASTDQPGEYAVTFQVANSAGDVSSLHATVEILEAAVPGAPAISLSKYIDYIPVGAGFDPNSYIDSVRINGKDYDVVPGAGNFNAEEVGADEEIVVGTDMIGVDSNVDTSTPGTYRVTYSMTLDRGHSEVASGHVPLYVVVR